MSKQTFFAGVQNDDRLDVDAFFGGVQAEANEAPAVGGATVARLTQGGLIDGGILVGGKLVKS